MKLLAFDTSTDHLSIAVSWLLDGRVQVRTHEGPGGAMASSTLIPAALALLAQAGLTLRELDAIVFGAGPGSFTGLRTACAVAQGLGYGAGVPLLPVDTLLAVAEEARHALAPAGGAFQVVAVLDARMDEVYAARYVWDGALWSPSGDGTVGKPETLSAWRACGRCRLGGRGQCLRGLWRAPAERLAPGSRAADRHGPAAAGPGAAGRRPGCCGPACAAALHSR
jgi:tRNA threonylcarbamoyl adenosine modification protein YeaZ